MDADGHRQRAHGPRRVAQTKRNALATGKQVKYGNNKEGNEDVVGNVGFADGHAGFMSRGDAVRARHSGNPNPDPAGF